MKNAVLYYSLTGSSMRIATYCADYLQCPCLSMEHENDMSSFDSIIVVFPVHYLQLPRFLADRFTSQNFSDSTVFHSLASFGIMTGKVHTYFSKLVHIKKGIHSGYHSIPVKESFPPYIKKGLSDDSLPKKKHVEKLNYFLEDIQKNLFPKQRKVKNGFFNSLIPVPTQEKIAQDFGLIHIAGDCDSCGICTDICPAKAIHPPAYNADTCIHCYACFNNCPVKAIYTDNVSGDYQFAGEILL